MMRVRFSIFFLFFLFFSSSPLQGADLQSNFEDTRRIWENEGAETGAVTPTSASMVKWGIGIAFVIALLAGSLHQSKADGAQAH